MKTIKNDSTVALLAVQRRAEPKHKRWPPTASPIPLVDRTEASEKIAEAEEHIRRAVALLSVAKTLLDQAGGASRFDAMQRYHG